MYDYPIEQDVSSAYYNLIFFFIILLILAFFVYVSFVVSTKQPDRVDISKADFDLFENQANKPDLLLTGEENQAKKLDYSKIHDFAAIRFCPAGQCVVNKKDGSKRCPENRTDALTYLPTREGCTRPNYCDDTEVPYALRSDGSAVDLYCGDDILKCRCLAQPQCAYHVTSTFDMLNGSVYGVNNNQLNYFFSINTEDKAFFNKNPIIINYNDIGKRFCKINPAFTDRIPLGCNFSDSTNDPIDCENSDLFQILPASNDEATLVVSNFAEFDPTYTPPPSPRPTPRPTPGPTPRPPPAPRDYNKGDNSISIFSSGQVLPKGLFKISVNSINYYIFYQSYTVSQYIASSNMDGGAGDNNGYTIYTLNGLVGQKEGDTTWNNGSPFDFTYNKGSDQNVVSTTVNDNHPGLTPEIIQFQPCTNNRPIANYKNMLRCVQANEQPCVNGTLAYNIDKIIDTSTTENIFQQNNSRNFCNAYNKDRFSTAKADTFYLNDPGSFTTSCVIGAGCDGTFDMNLCEDKNCKDAIMKRKNDFFDRYDESAVSNRWVISANEPVNFASIEIINGALPEIKLTNSAMFSLETGDYWSRHNSSIIKYLASNADPGATVLNLNNTQGVSVGNQVLYPGYSTLPSISDISGNNITLDSGINIGLSQGIGIEIINRLTDNDFGIIGIAGDKAYLLSIDGQSAVTLSDGQVNAMKKDGIAFYKQFGFNGINYNTTYDISGKVPLRYYAPSFVNNFFLSNTPGVQPVVEILGTLLTTFSDNKNHSVQAFNYSYAGFKNKKSMYYPVWNNSIFRQECIMCKPALFAFAGVTPENKIQSAQIQFSGKHYFNYVHNIQKDNYVYSTFTKIINNSDNTSNTNYLIMEDVNNNIAIGDYVLDSSGLINRKFQTSTSNPQQGTTLNFVKPDGPTINGINLDSMATTSLFQPFVLVDKKGKKITFTVSKINVNIIGSQQYSTDILNPAPNYFMGLNYQDDKGNYYELVPVTKIIDIIDTTGDGIKNVLMTDNGFTRELPMNQDIFIQTIRLSETLDLSVVQDLDNPDKATGSGAAIKVKEISNGRITNIEITNTGNNYSVENRPNILINNFYSGEEINILTQ